MAALQGQVMSGNIAPESATYRRPGKVQYVEDDVRASRRAFLISLWFVLKFGHTGPTREDKGAEAGKQRSPLWEWRALLYVPSPTRRRGVVRPPSPEHSCPGSNAIELRGPCHAFGIQQQESCAPLPETRHP